MILAGVSNPWPAGHIWPRMAKNVAQHKIVNLLKIFFFTHQFSLAFLYLMCGPRQLLSVWPRDAKSSDTPARASVSFNQINSLSIYSAVKPIHAVIHLSVCPSIHPLIARHEPGTGETMMEKNRHRACCHRTVGL